MNNRRFDAEKNDYREKQAAAHDQVLSPLSPITWKTSQSASFIQREIPLTNFPGTFFTKDTEEFFGRREASRTSDRRKVQEDLLIRRATSSILICHEHLSDIFSIFHRENQ